MNALIHRIYCCKLFSTIVFIVLLTSAISSAQPENRWIRLFDSGPVDEFLDVFAQRDGNFAMAGYSVTDLNVNGFWLVIADEDANEISQQTYTNNNVDPPYRARCFSVIQTDDGGYLMGGRHREQNAGIHFTVVKVDADLNQEWWRSYHERQDECNAVIETKAGNYVGAGHIHNDNRWVAHAVMLDPEGEVIWQNDYEQGRKIFAIREVDDGLLFAGQFQAGENRCWLLKTNMAGEEQWSQTYPGTQFRALISCRQGGFAACGSLNSDWLLTRLDDEGNVIWQRTFEFEGTGSALSIAQTTDGGFVMTGPGNWDVPTPSVVRTDPPGNEMWRRTDNNRQIGQVEDYRSTVIANDGMIMVAGATAIDRERGLDGVLLKIIPERSGPAITEFTPQEMELTVLLGDSLEFSVQAADLQEDSLRYIWTYDGEQISVQPDVLVHFEEIGNVNIGCTVSDGELETSIEWTVRVIEFLIRSHLPEELDLNIRRNSTIEFSINAEAVEDIELEYLWTFTNRNHQHEEIGNDDRVTVEFDLTGEHLLEASVSDGDNSVEVNWTINIYSCIYSWWPSELDLSTFVDSTLQFVVTPFNEDSDSLEYVWLLDDEQLGIDSASVHITFPEINQYEVTSIVRDGIEADTIRWTIEVLEWSSTEGDMEKADLPTSPVLYPVYPNPFNSTCTVSFYLPQSSFLSLSLYDVTGKSISQLINHKLNTGNHSITFDATELSTGFYILRMETGQTIKTRNMILIQ